MYLTQTEIINRWVGSNAPMTRGQILKDVINEDLNTDIKREMTDGVKYYEGENTAINERKRTYTVDGVTYNDTLKPNNQVAHGFLKILIDQTVAYMVGERPTINYNDDAFANTCKDLLKDEFYNTINEWLKSSCEKGIEWIHAYINSKGQFDYVITDARQIVPIYDTKYKKKLIAVIRYYPMTIYDSNGKAEERYRAEWWNDKQVEFYIEGKDGEFRPDATEEVNPKPHFTKENTGIANSKKGANWGRVPFIPLRNNPEEIPDIRWVKSMVDDYDLNVSDFSNALAELAEFIFVLRGYDGTDLSEFVKNLKDKHAIKVDESGGVDAVKPEISKDARDSHLDRLEENIYIFGQGVNPNTDKFGNAPSGIALKFMYLLLDLKAGTKERELEKAMKELIWFIAEYLYITKEKKYDTDKIEIVFNESMIVNKLEQITSCLQSKGVVSDETILENHPFVSDVEQEKERIAAQQPVIDLDETSTNNILDEDETR